MNIQESYLARLYATAFFNIYGKALTFDNYSHLIESRHFLLQNPDYLFIYKLPRHFILVKKQIVNKFFGQFVLPSIFYKLTDLLLEKDRLSLLPLVLKYIEIKYREYNNLTSAVISSSCPLAKKEQEGIEEILNHVSGKKPLATYNIDKNLIGGIRIQSDTLMWEYSIAKQLRTIEKELYRGD